MYKLIIGIDVSKAVLDVAYSHLGKTQYLMRVDNSLTGIEQFLNELKTICGTDNFCSWFVCFENTGVYSKALLNYLLAAQIPCIEEHPAKISVFHSLTRGKRDDWDAVRICNYAVTKQAELNPSKSCCQKIEKLKHLFSYRNTLVEKKRALASSVKEKKEFLDSDIIGFINESNDELIEVINKKLKAIEKRMLEIIKADDSINSNFILATSVVGIGKIIGVGLIIKTENFTKFLDPRKFSAQIGIAPFPNQSGTKTKRSRVSKKADIQMKALISNGVQAAIQFDPQIKNYYQRLAQKNKQPGIIMNNIKNKLIHRVFSVVQRGTPYVKLAA